MYKAVGMPLHRFFPTHQCSLFLLSDDRLKVLHGLDYLEKVHKADRPGYAWIIEQNGPEHESSGDKYYVANSDNYCYGYAFVVLAGASAMALGTGFNSYYI